MNAKQLALTFNPGDFTVPKDFLDTNLSAPAKLLYTVLATCSGGRDYAWPSQEYLAEKLKVHVRTIQRYLKELVDSGLIAKGKKFIKGQVRNIYHFLTRNGSDSCKKTDTTNLSPRSVSRQKSLPTDTTIYSDRYDKTVVPFNKDEELSREKNKIPPTPRAENETRTELPIPTLADGGGDKNFEVGKEAKTSEVSEEPEWTAAKKILAEKLSNGNFEAWIAPLIFEKTETGAILRVPNKFFQIWLSEHYGQELSEALKGVDIHSFNFELMTGVQQEKFENKSKIKNSGEMPKKLPPVAIDPDTLTLPEQFQKLYEAYPRKERFVRAKGIFMNLMNSDLLPKVSELIQAAKKQFRNKESWQRGNGRFVPQLHRWLAEGGWAD